MKTEKKDPRLFFYHDSPAYRRRWVNSGDNRFNGAFYYSKEIVANIMPHVKTDRKWITVMYPGMACNHSIFFVHNNLHPENYEWLKAYKDVILVCGIPETVEKVSHIGKAIYLPLSVDIEALQRYKPIIKTREVAYVGRKPKRNGIEFPEGTVFLEGMPRPQLLQAMGLFKKVYAVGRTALEAKVLGCEVLPYDPRFPDPERWVPIDNQAAAMLLQGALYDIDDPFLGFWASDHLYGLEGLNDYVGRHDEVDAALHDRNSSDHEEKQSENTSKREDWRSLRRSIESV